MAIGVEWGWWGWWINGDEWGWGLILVFLWDRVWIFQF